MVVTRSATMTQSAQSPHSQSNSQSEITTINLTRLLARLDERLPPVIDVTTKASTSHEKPIPSVVERKKIAANLEYARQLLLQLETEYAMIKSGAQRERIKVELAGKKGAIRKLNERLHLIEELEAQQEEEEEEENDNEEYGGKMNGNKHSKQSNLTEPASTLRNRFQHDNKDNTTTTITTTTTAIATTSSSELFSSLGSGEKPNTDLDSVLSSHRQQQEVLTEDLLKMARMLKESSLQFGKQLEDEKPFLDQAATGLDKTALGMETTGGKLDSLRKDGSVGWYRTLINMAIIICLGMAGLMILLMPKLRR